MQQISFEIPTLISPFEPIQLEALDCFNNPSTTQLTNSFLMEIFSDSQRSQALDFQSSDLQMQAQVESLDETQAAFQQLPDSQGGTGEVSKSTPVILVLRNKIALPRDSLIIVDFPKLNPEAPTSQRKTYIFDAQKISCKSILNSASGVSCRVILNTLNQDFIRVDRLMISGAFPQGLEANKMIKIQVNNLTNPLSMGVRQFFTAFSVFSPQDNQYFNLEQGFTSFKATQPASISQVEILADNQVVQEYVDLQIKFRHDVEIEPGAIFLIQFPSSFPEKQFVFDNLLTTVSVIGGMFGARIPNAPFSVDLSTMRIQTTQGTEKYSTIGNPQITVSKIRNPTYVGRFDDFKIQIFDKQQSLIAQSADKSFSYSTVAGSIENMSLEIEQQSVETWSRLTLTFQPVHLLESQSSIKIFITNSLKVNCEVDLLRNSLIFQRPLQIDCSDSADGKSTLIQFRTPFLYDYSFPSNLTLVFPKVRTPLSAIGISGLRIETYNSFGKLVDASSEMKEMFRAQGVQLMSQQIKTQKDETSSVSFFTFILGISSSLLPNSSIYINLPPQISIADPKNLKVRAISSNLNSSLSIQAVGDKQLRISSFIDTSRPMLTQGDIIQFEIDSLITPISTRTSDSFSVFIRDNLNNLINYETQGLMVTMPKGKRIDQIEIIPESFTTGAFTKHKISFNLNIPLLISDQILIIYPPQSQAPTEEGVCQGINGLDKDSNCVVIQNLIRFGSLKFADKSQSQLPVGQKVDLQINRVTNPPTSQASQALQLYIKDQEGFTKAETNYQENDSSSDRLQLKMTIPNPISDFAIKPWDIRQLATTAYRVQWRSELKYPAQSYVLITINPDQIGPEDQSKVSCSSNIQFNLTCSFPSSSIIRVDGLFPKELPSNIFIWVTITNLKNKLITATLTQSWILTVFTKDNFFIESISNGLSINFLCTLPCQTCKSNQPNQCTSCSQLQEKKFIFENKCYEVCPTTTFLNQSAFACQKCHSPCKECSIDNGHLCTSCDASSPFPFFDGKTCVADCPFGFYGNKTTALCMPCESPCQSCKNGPKDCSTCDVKSDFRFFQEGICIKACSDGFLVPLGFNDFVCRRCNSNCKTCIDTADYCTSCSATGNMMLSLLDNKCYQSCPAQVTVKRQGENVCEICEEQCKTCEKSTNFCTSCFSNHFLIEKKCVRDCKDFVSGGQSFKFVNSIDQQIGGVCQACSNDCNQCQEKTDYCINCVPESQNPFMFNYKCLSQCPEKYSPRNGKCVLTGFFCPFGYDMNEAGDGCILSSQVCLDNHQLNYDKTMCIPIPGFLLPFPLLVILIIGAVFIYRDKRLHPEQRFFTNLTCLLSLLESVGLIFVVGLSNAYGIKPTFLLTSLALVFLLGLNLFFSILYFKQFRLDSAFKHWLQEFGTKAGIIVSFGLLANFRIYRLFFSKWGNRKEFDAVMSDESIFLKSVVFTGVFYFLSGSLPIIVGCIFGVIHIKFGYQTQMFCIEMIVIESLLFVSSIVEMFQLRRKLFARNFLQINPVFGVEKGYETQQFLVMSIGDQDSSRFQNQSAVDDRQEQQKLKEILSKIQHKDAGLRNFEAYPTFKVIQDMHEEIKRKRQLRRCISFRDAREYQEEDSVIDDVDLDPSDILYRLDNFISEPSSPRTKEMLINPFFSGRMTNIAKAFIMNDQFDNCYHEAKPAYFFQIQDQVVSRMVQTNVLDLLGVDEILPNKSRAKSFIRSRDGMNTVDGERQTDAGEEMKNATDEMSRQWLDTVLFSFEGFQERKKRRRLPPNRVKQLPVFEIEDILGRFDINDLGDFILISEGDSYYDKEGREVNCRGYLLDDQGNVVTKDGVFIFRNDEIDEDGEIPAPFCYLKNKKILGMELKSTQFGSNNLPPDQVATAVEQDMEEEIVQKELRRLENKRDGSQDWDQDKSRIPPSHQIKRRQRKTSVPFNPNDQDQMYQVTAPLKPVRRNKVILPPSPPKVSSSHHSISQNKKAAEIEDFKTIQPEDIMLFQPELTLHQIISSPPVDLQNQEGATSESNSFEEVYLPKRKSKSGKRRRRNQKGLGREDTGGTEEKGLEQLEQLLARHPVRRKVVKDSNSLAARNLARVYGNLSKQSSNLLKSRTTIHHSPDKERIWSGKYLGSLPLLQEMQVGVPKSDDLDAYIQDNYALQKSIIMRSSSRPDQVEFQNEGKMREISTIYGRNMIKSQSKTRRGKQPSPERIEGEMEEWEEQQSQRVSLLKKGGK